MMKDSLVPRPIPSLSMLHTVCSIEKLGMDLAYSIEKLGMGLRMRPTLCCRLNSI